MEVEASDYFNDTLQSYDEESYEIIRMLTMPVTLDTETNTVRYSCMQ